MKTCHIACNGVCATALVVLFAACRAGGPADEANLGEVRMTITVTSSAFGNGQAIPERYTCDGAGVSPPLRWEGVPAATVSLALIADDPDAPRGVWSHWVVYNLPPDTVDLAEDQPTLAELPNGAKQGENDFGKVGYGGPCPPSGTHRYFFKVYALGSALRLGGKVTRESLLNAMKGHVLAVGELMGTYHR